MRYESKISRVLKVFGLSSIFFLPASVQAKTPCIAASALCSSPQSLLAPAYNSQAAASAGSGNFDPPGGSNFYVSRAGNAQIGYVNTIPGIGGWRLENDAQETMNSPNQVLHVEKDELRTNTSGNHGQKFSAHVETDVGESDNDDEWNLFAQLIDDSNGASGSKDVALYAQALREPRNGQKNVSQIWSFVDEVDDYSGRATGSLGGSPAEVGNEIDLSADFADNAPNAETYGDYGVRKGLDLVVRRSPAKDPPSAVAEFSSGLWVTQDNRTDKNYIQLDQAYGVGNGLAAYNVFDCRGAVLPPSSGYQRGAGPLNCLNMQKGMAVDFASDVGGTQAITEPPQRYLSYNASTAALTYVNGTTGTPLFAVSDSGALRMGGVAAIPSAGPGAGISGSAVTSSNSHSFDGQVTVTTGTSPAASTPIVSVALQTTFPSAPNCVFSPNNESAAALNGPSAVYITTSSSTMSFNAGTKALSARTRYVWSYHCAD